MSERDSKSAGPAAAGGWGQVTPVKKPLKGSRDPEKWRRADEVPFRPGPVFFALANPLVEADRTLLGYDRLYVFWQAIHNLARVPGDAAEIGAYRGGSAYFIAAALATLTGEEVPLHVFDTFEGHPAAALSVQDPFTRPASSAVRATTTCARSCRPSCSPRSIAATCSTRCPS